MMHTLHAPLMLRCVCYCSPGQTCTFCYPSPTLRNASTSAYSSAQPTHQTATLSLPLCPDLHSSSSSLPWSGSQPTVPSFFLSFYRLIFAHSCVRTLSSPKQSWSEGRYRSHFNTWARGQTVNCCWIKVKTQNTAFLSAERSEDYIKMSIRAVLRLSYACIHALPFLLYMSVKWFCFSWSLSALSLTLWIKQAFFVSVLLRLQYVNDLCYDRLTSSHVKRVGDAPARLLNADKEMTVWAIIC